MTFIEHVPVCICGVVLGAASLWAGYWFSQKRSKELPPYRYLQQVPQFTNMKKLHEHLENCPDKKADVLIEGVVKKHGGALKSENGVEGAAKLVTTYKEVYDSAKKKSSICTDDCNSVTFQLSDENGETVTVRQIHDAGGFQHAIKKEFSGGSHTKEYLMTFGTTLGMYGTATLTSGGYISSAGVDFIPSIVSTTTTTRDRFLSFMSMLFVVGGGGLLLFFTVSLAMRALGYQVQVVRKNKQGKADVLTPSR